MSSLLTRAQFNRLCKTQQDAYLKKLCVESDDESVNHSDSDDDDWIPDERNQNEVSDNEENRADENDSTQVASDDSESDDDDDTNTDVDAVSTADPTARTFVAKDKTVWQKTPPNRTQTLRHNIVRQTAGPHRSTETLSAGETFKKIITHEMVDLISRYTNQKANQVIKEYNEESSNELPRTWKNVTRQEMYSFFGILIAAGVNNSNKDHTTEMWKTSSFPLYRATMSLNRFWNIIRFIRFDDARTREQRSKEDKAAPISEIWAMMNANLSALYRPGTELTIDEQLYPYRGRTRFTQYIPSKPAKYGIKVWWICDAENAYPLNGIIYTGKSGNVREKNQGENVVKKLAAPYKGSGRNISMDNFFTTLPIAKLLLTWDLTIVGTVRKNKPYIPKEMTASKDRAALSTLFGFHENTTICSYVPKKNKAVILFSTMHSDMAVADNAEKKPEIILYYNQHKAGVDTMDQMTGRYTTHRRTNRWPLAMFFNVLDISALAAFVIYKENNSMLPKKTNARRMFLLELSKELALPSIHERSENVQITRHFSTKLAIESIIGKLLPPMPTTQREHPTLDKTGRKKVTGCCHICLQQDLKRRRKTRKACRQCELPVCDQHATTLVECNSCYKSPSE